MPPVPGKYDEEWIAHGTFTGSINDTAASASLGYSAEVRKGGDVMGQIVFGDGVKGQLTVTGNFSDGFLAYTGSLE
jgi:hypothetical protein